MARKTLVGEYKGEVQFNKLELRRLEAARVLVSPPPPANASDLEGYRMMTQARFVHAAVMHAVDEVLGLPREERRQRSASIDQWKHEIEGMEDGAH